MGQKYLQNQSFINLNFLLINFNFNYFHFKFLLPYQVNYQFLKKNFAGFRFISIKSLMYIKIKFCHYFNLIQNYRK